MAKKVVATLKSKDQTAGMTKVIRAVKNESTGAYAFKAEMVPTENLQEYLKNLESR
jgi:hypothetical protein